MMSVMLILIQCPGALGRAMALTVNCALLAYHYFGPKALVPPLPVVVMATISCASCWIAFAGKKKKAKEAQA